MWHDLAEWSGNEVGNFGFLATTSVDLSYTVQDFLPYIALRFEFGESLTGQPSTHRNALFSDVLLLMCSVEVAHEVESQLG